MKNINLTSSGAILVLALFISFTSIAGFEPGYLVTQSGDTLTGAFKFNMMGIKLKPDNGGKPETFPLEQIAVYSYTDEDDVFYNFENLFYSLTIDDQVSLYERTNYQTMYNGQQTTTIVQYSFAVKKPDETELTLLRMTSTLGRGKMYFIEEASTYFSDFPDLAVDIKNGKYNKPIEIEEMVKRYNIWWHETQQP